MSDLVQFLLNRIAEDETAARAASGDRWDRLREGAPKFRKVVAWGLTPIGAMNAQQDADHIARHDPARVLAECEAKRRIVAQYQGATLARDNNQGTIARLLGDTIVETLTELLPLLALPYADHPDYRQEWKP